MIKRAIPNILTLGNLSCGLVAIILLLHPFGEEIWVLGIVMLMIAALLFDFLDGFIARLLNVQSAFGKQLDSLADLVTFGVLPGMIMYFMMSHHAWMESSSLNALPLIGLLIPIFSALRLAKFNIDDRQSDAFYGLPTPANAILILSIFLYHSCEGFSIFSLTAKSDPTQLSPGLFFPVWQNFSFFLTHPISLCIISVLTALLMVLPIRLLALKFKKYSWRGNGARYLFISISLILLIIFLYKAVPLIIVFYIIVSFIDNFRRKNEIPREN